MSNSRITKQALAGALKECMKEKPLEKISIGEICQRCGLNRKSLYYHFRDKYDLVNWIYDTEIDEKVQKEYKEKDLTTVALMICHAFYDNRSFYLNALQVTGPYSLHDHFCRSIQPLVDKVLEVGEDSSLDLEELSETIGDFCLSAVRRWLGRANPQTPEEFLDNLAKVSVTICTKMLALVV